jgi:A/G-specific adenine glycosylase
VLQQTRVTTVIPYFNNWISKWPSVHALAAASSADVLAAWKGLGYYSRATRLHQGAQEMVSRAPTTTNGRCPIPSTAAELMQVPGIGRYTAGAVSSIAFGAAEPVLDGNVVRVLSRQMGVFADGKERRVGDVLWEVADRLVGNVAGAGEGKSKVPGMWNQAVMELGSTVCTPRPKCGVCPVQRTCRAFAEGKVLAERKRGDGGGVVGDVEDVCGLCEELDTEDLVTAPEVSGGEEEEEEDEEEADEKPKKKRKVVKTKPVNTISRYFTAKVTTRSTTTATTTVATTITTTANDQQDSTEDETTNKPPNPDSQKRKAPSANKIPKSVLTYCSLFPKKIPKKKPAEEECVVCIIELHQPSKPSKYLIEQRPAKGSLSTLPSLFLPLYQH